MLEVQDLFLDWKTVCTCLSAICFRLFLFVNSVFFLFCLSNGRKEEDMRLDRIKGAPHLSRNASPHSGGPSALSNTNNAQNTQIHK